MPYENFEEYENLIQNLNKDLIVNDLWLVRKIFLFIFFLEKTQKTFTNLWN